MNTNIILPTLFYCDDYAIALASVCDENNIENPLKYSYGTVRCKWAFNYDSTIKFGKKEKDFIDNILSIYSKSKINPIINFSRTNITDKDLQDEFCNYYLDTAYKYGCKVIAGSDMLFEYIKNKYPDIEIISSVNKPRDLFQEYEENPEKELEFYDKTADKYDRVIIRPEFNKYLEKGYLPGKIDKMCVIINNGCKINCKYFKECRDFELSNFLCIRNYEKKNDGIEKSLENISMLSNEQIKSLRSLGFNNFMLQDNKQSLLVLYPLFNKYLFDDFKKYLKINNIFRRRIRELAIANNRYEPNSQVLLIASLVANQQAIDEI